MFVYGVKSSDGPELGARIFPALMAGAGTPTGKCDGFSFLDCSFVIPRGHYSTARAVVRHQFNVTNSYTLEASFLGPSGSEMVWPTGYLAIHHESSCLRAMSVDAAAGFAQECRGWDRRLWGWCLARAGPC